MTSSVAGFLRANLLEHLVVAEARQRDMSWPAMARSTAVWWRGTRGRVASEGEGDGTRGQGRRGPRALP